MVETGQYPEDCRAWRNQDDKSWTAFQAHPIEAQANLRERQKTSRQDGYGANNLVGIEGAFANLSQETAEDRAKVTNLTDSNKHLENQVAEKSNNMAIKDVAINTMQKLIQKLQEYIRTLKTRQAVLGNKKTGSSGYIKGSWGTSPYCWSHGASGHQGVEYMHKR